MTSSLSQIYDSAALGGPLAAISFVAGVAGATALSDAPYPRPGSSPEQIKRYFSDNSGPARISSGWAVARTGDRFAHGRARHSRAPYQVAPSLVIYGGSGYCSCGGLAPVALKVKPAVWLIPASLFPGLLISGIAGAMLMRSTRAE
jgi:hypothetical protein